MHRLEVSVILGGINSVANLISFYGYRIPPAGVSRRSNVARRLV